MVGEDALRYFLPLGEHSGIVLLDGLAQYVVVRRVVAKGTGEGL